MVIKKITLFAMLWLSLSTHGGLKKPSLAESQYYDRAKAFAVMMEAYKDATVANECVLGKAETVAVVTHGVFVLVDCEVRNKALSIIEEQKTNKPESAKPRSIWTKGIENGLP